MAFSGSTTGKWPTLLDYPATNKTDPADLGAKLAGIGGAEIAGLS